MKEICERIITIDPIDQPTMKALFTTIWQEWYQNNSWIQFVEIRTDSPESSEAFSRLVQRCNLKKVKFHAVEAELQQKDVVLERFLIRLYLLNKQSMQLIVSNTGQIKIRYYAIEEMSNEGVVDSFLKDILSFIENENETSKIIYQ